ncbi:MAG: hypothetical protein JWP03_2794 [Phycisphaerales bacterium]|nr:hypothetical protein [Phycisphaerales bacterium]
MRPSSRVCFLRESSCSHTRITRHPAAASLRLTSRSRRRFPSSFRCRLLGTVSDLRIKNQTVCGLA